MKIILNNQEITFHPQKSGLSQAAIETLLEFYATKKLEFDPKGWQEFSDDDDLFAAFKNEGERFEEMMVRLESEKTILWTGNSWLIK